YPISGTWYLFDPTRNSYTFDREIANARRLLGDVDFIDISSWGWSSAAGRVGDYRIYQLGGLENFRQGIEYSQSEGAPVGLYIEGYNIDDRSSVYQAHGVEWEMIDANGNPRRLDDHEVNICPYPDAWQEHMRQLYADVVTE